MEKPDDVSQIKEVKHSTSQPRFGVPIYRQAIIGAFSKLSPVLMFRNPVMFIVEIASVFTTILAVMALFGKGDAPAVFIWAITGWLWLTLLLRTSQKHWPKDVVKLKPRLYAIPVKRLPQNAFFNPNMVPHLR